MPLKTTHGLLAEFDAAEPLIAAAERIHQAGYRHVEAFSPYPLPEAAEALGYHRPGVAGLVFAGGLIGGASAFLMQYWISVWSYPANVGGRPLKSWPPFIPVTFELTVLLASLAGFFGVLALCGLPRYHHPLFASERFARSSTDRFYLCVESTDPLFDLAATRAFLEGLSPLGVEEVAP
jgi:hypothetical protein